MLAIKIRYVQASVLCISILGTVLGGPLLAQDSEPSDAEATPAEGDESGKDEKQPRTVNLIIQGAEADKWNLDVGGGWNEGDGAYGRFAISSPNFLGRGEIFGLTIEAGPEHELYEVEYQRPFLFGRRQSLGIRLFHDYTEHPIAGADFSQRRSGGALTYGRRFRAHQRFDLEYRFADIDQRESSFGDNGEGLFRGVTYSSSSLRPAWVFDSLDSRLSPFEGLRIAAALEVAGGVLGGDTDLVKPTVALTWFQPLSRQRPRSTFSLRTRLGLIDARGDSRLSTQQYFFAGGEDSVRGFRRNSIAALNEDGTLAVDAFGLPQGGEQLAQLNLEYHLLLNKRFRLVVFADAGGVFAPDQSFDADLMRTSAGAELRINLPKLNLPLRLIYARNLDPLPEDNFRDFSFSVGVSF